MDLIDNSAPSLKPDNSVLTKADGEISRLTHQRLKSFLSTPNHILIDEEDPENKKYLNPKTLKDAQYLWALDPIDGTLPFANKMHGFGISIGLLKDLKPWMGMVYFPSLKELFYCDGTNAYFVKNAFTPDEKRQRITPINQTITPRSVFFVNDDFFQRFEWDFSVCSLMATTCAVVDFCSCAIGRGAGGFMRSYLWDFAGAWPICKAAGLNLRSLETGELLEGFDLKKFVTKPPHSFILHDHYLLSSEQNFAYLRSKIKSHPF